MRLCGNAVTRHRRALERGPCGAANGGRRLDAELASEQAPASLRLRERAGAIAARGEAADEQFMVGLVERVDGDQPHGELGRPRGVPGGQLVQRGVVERCRHPSGVPPARHDEP
jgi:hypothetical protein